MLRSTLTSATRVRKIQKRNETGFNSFLDIICKTTRQKKNVSKGPRQMNRSTNDFRVKIFRHFSQVFWDGKLMNFHILKNVGDQL